MAMLLALGYTNVAQAQKSRKATKQQSVQKRASNKTVKKTPAATADTAFSLTSASANQAFGNAPARRFSIADPLVNTLNQQAAGAETQVSSSGIVGMPKRTYGFANGKILLRNTTATTSGTNYGSGAVGTGTTIMGLGTGENTPGTNGKSPYAGPWIWGSKLPGRNLPAVDSVRRNQ